MYEHSVLAAEVAKQISYNSLKKYSEYIIYIANQ